MVIWKPFNLEIQNGVTITVGICRDQQNHKILYEYYTKLGFLITLIVLIGCLQVKRYHRVANFTRKRLLSACEVWITILALENVALKSTNQIKDYTKRSDFCSISSIYLFKYSFHSIAKWQKSVDITWNYVLYIDLNREMFYSVLGMCRWPWIQNGVYCQMLTNKKI